jgi:preprotein translocase subunit YajC
VKYLFLLPLLLVIVCLLLWSSQEERQSRQQQEEQNRIVCGDEWHDAKKSCQPIIQVQK